MRFFNVLKLLSQFPYRKLKCNAVCDFLNNNKSLMYFHSKILETTQSFLDEVICNVFMNATFLPGS